MTIRIALTLAILALLTPFTMADDLEGIKCLVNPKMDATENASAKHMEGTVYFCCNGCKGKFEKDPEKYAPSANFQLVSTKQYKQKACPFTGNAVNEEATTKIGEKLEVGFCCNNCKGKVDGAKDDAEKINMVFAKAAFKKGFEVAKDEDDIDLSDVKCPMMGEDVSAEFVADYKDGKVYFCCESCLEEFTDDPEAHAAKLNLQLVQTKQFEQTGCPFSGGKVKDGTQVKIGETEVGFCCPNCQGKVADAKDDEARTQLVFSEQAFKKGFAKKEK